MNSSEILGFQVFFNHQNKYVESQLRKGRINTNMHLILTEAPNSASSIFHLFSTSVHHKNDVGSIILIL